MSLLKLSKHTNLQYSTLNVSAHILKILRENSVVGFNELLDILKDKIGQEVGEVFVANLTFLFIHKKIEYSIESDSIRLVNEII